MMRATSATTRERSGTQVALSVRGLDHRYGPTVALDDVSLDIAPGELLALVGPSGCGKTTLLRAVAGLLRPEAGRIRVAGREVTGETWVPPERRGIGLVFQDHALFPHLDVAGNLAFGLRSLSRSQQRDRVHEVLEIVDLVGYEGRYPHELSGGERQRVALGRSLAPGPAVMLLDEPFANLDHNLRVEVRAETTQILRSARTAVLFVTHDQQEALSLGDRVAVMRSGRIEQLDIPEVVFHKPTTTFVATFMGDADFLPAHYNGNGSLQTEAGACPAPDAVPGGFIQIMVRPHEVRLEARPEGDGTVVRSEFHGGFILYEIELHSGRRLRSIQPHTLKLEPGAKVSVALDHGHVPAVLVGSPAEATAAADPSPAIRARP